jgi:two-component system C4-dicarboxylate transport sensor histidine kinase DctB
MGRAEIRVEDTGPGVDATIGDTLFTPFTTSKPGGLGLGLAIARDIAREFGGDLRHVPLPGGTLLLADAARPHDRRLLPHILRRG